MSVLEKQTTDAAAEKEKRLAAAKILAEEAVKEARTGRMTELANLIAAALALVRKSGRALHFFPASAQLDPICNIPQFVEAQVEIESKR